MKNKYVISSLTALSAMSIASCNYTKMNVQYFEIGLGANIVNFLESDSESLFGINGSIQGYFAKGNCICGMIDGYASWSTRSTFNPTLPFKSGADWIDSPGLKGYVFDGDIAIGKDFCLSDNKAIKHHKTRDHDLYSRIGIGIDLGGRKTSFKNKDSVTPKTDTAMLTKVDTHSLFVGAKCKMMYPMDNALVIFDIKAGPVVYGKGEYVAIDSGSTRETIKTDQNIGAEVKAGFSGIYRMHDNDFGIGMKISVDYNYRTEEVTENKTAAIFKTPKGEELDGAFSNNILGTIEFIFVYSTV